MTSHLPNVEVDGFRDLLIRYMNAKQAHVIVRGLRAVSDYEHELQLAATNRAMNEEVETLFLTSSPNYSFLSSSIVKEIAKYNGPVADLVPAEVEAALRRKYQDS